jgi:hypothetical protein
VAADGSAVQMKKADGDTVEVTVAGQPFTTFHYGDDLPKPFFSPVRAPDGTVLTRPVGGKVADHPHHKGIWLAIDEVNKVKFWAEQGKIVNLSVELSAPEGDPAVMKVKNHWVDPDGKPVVTEETTVRVFAGRVVEYDTIFRAEHGEVVFEDTKEGLFGFRMVDSMREREGGKVTSSEGREGSKANWGLTAAWVDYYGPVDGKTYGVAIFDHPKNFRPSRYHVRDYGLFSVSPFGERSYTGGKSQAEPVELEPGETLRLRYAMYIHAGDTESAAVQATYEKWLAATK